MLSILCQQITEPPKLDSRLSDHPGKGEHLLRLEDVGGLFWFKEMLGDKD